MEVEAEVADRLVAAGPRPIPGRLPGMDQIRSRDANWAALHEQETAQATLTDGPCDYAD